MTIDEVLVMKPGAELDKLVAERVFNAQVKCWETLHDRPIYRFLAQARYGETWEHLPKYSENIAAAWPVAEKMGLAVVPLNNGSWLVCKANVIYSLRITDDHYQDDRLVISPIVPEAVCKAALLALQNCVGARKEG